MKFLNFGSLNVDKVYTVPHFVREGETLASLEYNEFAGGKGLNQSIALAKAGTNVFHAGRIGEDGHFLIQTLEQEGINTDNIYTYGSITGHAIIQVNSNAENCILLLGGANKQITTQQIDSALDKFTSADFLVIQNEINDIEYIINAAHEKGLTIALNPSPIDDNIKTLDFSKIDYLIFNEIEGKEISGETQLEKILDTLLSKYSNLKLVLTLGEKGVIYKDTVQKIRQDIFNVNVVDTTAAGDTFLGYFLSIISRNAPIKEALRIASKAASIVISRDGASISIPDLAEVTEEEAGDQL